MVEEIDALKYLDELNVKLRRLDTTIVTEIDMREQEERIVKAVSENMKRDLGSMTMESSGVGN